MGQSGVKVSERSRQELDNMQVKATLAASFVGDLLSIYY